jgi:toluene monooxygenase system ferredoxin subunit
MAWKPLCKLGEIEPGTMKVVAAEGIDFLVLRGSEDELLVVPPRCPHMDTSLCDGFFDGSLLTCSQHLWQWSVKDGSMQGIAEEPLAVYPSKALDDTVCVDFERELRYHPEAES